MIKIRRGLNLPIAGSPEQVVHDGPMIDTVALVGPDYVGMKPTMLVKEGDRVKLGEPLFTDKKNPVVRYTAPASGIVAAIHRGERRALLSVEIEIDGDEQVEFSAWQASELPGLKREQVVSQLLESGLWTALRTRPYSKVPEPELQPNSLFVTAMDTNPLAADPVVVIREREPDFLAGLQVLAHLTDGPVHLCTAPGAPIPDGGISSVKRHEFGGMHPAGLVGTHIHFIDPVSEHKTVWHVGYQDVIAVGALFTSGKLDVSRVIALSGPQVLQPRLIRTRLGASFKELAAGQLKDGDNRLVSGSVLSGRTGRGALAFLGRYHLQVTALLEGRQRELFRYLSPGRKRHSITPIYLSSLLGLGRLAMTTNTNGSERAMVPIGNYERVMPLDILATQLLRYLVVGDTEMAQKLGCLELDEEDLALCTYACIGKYEYGPILRDNLTRIEKEG